MWVVDRCKHRNAAYQGILTTAELMGTHRSWHTMYTYNLYNRLLVQKASLDNPCSIQEAQHWLLGFLMSYLCRCTPMFTSLGDACTILSCCIWIVQGCQQKELRTSLKTQTKRESQGKAGGYPSSPIQQEQPFKVTSPTMNFQASQ